MIYETFKKKVIQEFLSYMSQKYSNMQFISKPVSKVNIIKDGLYLLSSSDMFRVSPAIYIDDMYKDYKKNENFKFVMKEYAEKLEKMFNNTPQLICKDIFDKNRIFFQLIHTKQNQELLSNLPCRTWNDLSIIYRWDIAISNEQVISQIINNDFARYMDMNEMDFFKAAWINTKKEYPTMIKNMNDVMLDIILENGVFKDLVDLYVNNEEWNIWIISNQKNYYGAVSILYEEELYKLAQQLDKDLYLLPVSIHEMIIVPAITFDLFKKLSEIVFSIYQTLNVEERLSNQIYYYDKNLRKIYFATDSKLTI